MACNRVGWQGACREILAFLGKGDMMAKMVKGAKRYVLVRGKDENGNDIVIDMFNKKEFDRARKERRVQESDHIVKVEVLENVNLKKLEQSKRG